MNKIYKLMLKQAIGAKNRPIVTQYEEVKKGQLIAVPDGMGVNLHSSVDGKITQITDTAIHIEAHDVQNHEFISIKNNDNIIESIKEAGLVGMGGAGFPTHIKLSSNIKFGTIIANAIECEPLLKHNIIQIINHPELLYKGVKYAMDCTDSSHGIIAIKSKNKEAIQAIKNIIQIEDNITIAELDDLYPMGEERAIIREVFGKLLNVDELPISANCIVLNCETLSRITEIVELHKPVISKNITIVGDFENGDKYKVITDVPIGRNVGDLIEEAGINTKSYGEIIMGGPFTGHSISVDDNITKTSSGIIVSGELIKQNNDLGLLVCACGGNEERLREIASKMGASVVAVEKCKQAVYHKGNLKCENPGHCPGQAEKILALRKKGARALLISTCSDCTNTVMCIAPNLKMPVHHSTDHFMRTAGHSLIRKLT